MTAQPRFSEVDIKTNTQAPKKVRISSMIKAAVDAMVFEGVSRPEAAKAAGCGEDNLRLALKRPNVLAYLNEQSRVLRTSAAARSIARIDNLADKATSEHVQFESNKFLLGIEGTAPIHRSEINANVRLSTPGYVIDLTQAAPSPVIPNQRPDGEKASNTNAVDAEFSMAEDENE